MKAPLTHYWCLIKSCDWEIVNHKNMDGLKCPKCNFGVMSKRTTKDSEHIVELINSGRNEENIKVHEDYLKNKNNEWRKN